MALGFALTQRTTHSQTKTTSTLPLIVIWIERQVQMEERVRQKNATLMHDSDTRPVVFLGRKLQRLSTVSLRSSNSWCPQTRRQRNASTCFFSPFMSSSHPSRGFEIRTLEIVGEEEWVEARKDTTRNLLIQKPNDQTAFQQLQNAQVRQMERIGSWGEKASY